MKIKKELAKKKLSNKLKAANETRRKKQEEKERKKLEELKRKYDSDLSSNQSN